MRTTLSVSGVVVFLMLLPALAKAQCNSFFNTVPDGRLLTRTLANTADVGFFFDGTPGHSYSVEVHFPDVASGVTVNFGDASISCPTVDIAGLTLTNGTDPPSPTRSIRGSFTTSAVGTQFYVTHVVNNSGSAVEFTYTVSDTTTFSPAWSTNGSFDTFYSFQNTTNNAISGTLSLSDTSGTVISTTPLTVPVNGTASTNTAALGTARSKTGTAKFTHNGPPGSFVCEAAIASFAISPPFVQTVKCTAPREATH